MRHSVGKGITLLVLLLLTFELAPVLPWQGGCNNEPYVCVLGPSTPVHTTASLQGHIDGCRKRATKARCAFARLSLQGNLTSGSVELPSNFTLAVEATWKASTNRSEFPLIPPLPSYGTARDNCLNVSAVHRPLVYGNHVENVQLTGRGTIDGQGGIGGWWAQEKNGTLPFQRPRLVQFVHARNVSVDGGLTLQNSPFWTLHLVYSEDVLVQNVSILAPRDSPNTDGVDVDSTKNVRVTGCVIDVGDDAVAVKSGLNEYGLRVNISSENILIEHNRIFGKAIAVGSEMSGGVYNVTARHNLMGDALGAVTGLLIKSARGRGGLVNGITFENNHLLNVSKVYSWIPALVISDHYGGGGKPSNATTTPHINGIRFVNITVDFAEQVGCLQGLPEAHLQNIVFSNVTIAAHHSGWACQFCDGCDVCDSQASQTKCAFT